MRRFNNESQSCANKQEQQQPTPARFILITHNSNGHLYARRPRSQGKVDEVGEHLALQVSTADGAAITLNGGGGRGGEGRHGGWSC
jgi:hypothetical protein